MVLADVKSIRVWVRRTRRPGVEGSGDDQTAHGEREQTGSCLRDDNVEVLFQAVDTPEEETHAHDQQQVGQHTTDERSLDNDNLSLHERDDSDDKFDGITTRVRLRPSRNKARGEHTRMSHSANHQSFHQC